MARSSDLHYVAKDDSVLSIRQHILDLRHFASLCPSVREDQWEGREGTHVDASDKANEHRVHASNHSRKPLAMAVLLPRNRLASVVSSKAETLTFLETQVLSARMP